MNKEAFKMYKGLVHDLKTWTFGSYLKTSKKDYIVYIDPFGTQVPVGIIPETASPYIGYDDIYGREIFLNDIVDIEAGSGRYKAKNCVVKFKDGRLIAEGDSIQYPINDRCKMTYRGNIFISDK